jgi:hypothetical protein
MAKQRSRRLVPLLNRSGDRAQLHQTGRMRDTLGVLLVTVGLIWAVVTRDKVGLVIAFGGVSLLAYGVLKPRSHGRRRLAGSDLLI